MQGEEGRAQTDNVSEDGREVGPVSVADTIEIRYEVLFDEEPRDQPLVVATDESWSSWSIRRVKT